MGTTSHFVKDVKDDATGELIELDVGTTNYAGKGPQMYLKLGEAQMILSEKDAKAFLEGVEGVAHYLGYWK